MNGILTDFIFTKNGLVHCFKIWTHFVQLHVWILVLEGKSQLACLWTEDFISLNWLVSWKSLLIKDLWVIKPCLSGHPSAYIAFNLEKFDFGHSTWTWREIEKYSIYRELKLYIRNKEISKRDGEGKQASYTLIHTS